MANALTEWRLGSRRHGAHQMWEGYVNAVGMARAMLAGDDVPHIPEMVADIRGEAWGRRVRRYALDLAIEAVEEAGR